MHFKLNALDLRINILHNGCQDSKGRNYLVYIRAPRWSLMGRGRSISLVLKTRRGRSARLGLRILNILRPPWKIRMIPLTMIIGIRIRVVGWRKSLGSIHLFSHTVRLTNIRTIKKSMHGTSTNRTHILYIRGIRHFIHT